MLEAVRAVGIPIAENTADRTFFIVCVSDSSKLEITELEAQQIRSYAEFECVHFYGRDFDSMQGEWKGQTSAADPGHNTVTLYKHDEGDWLYVRFTQHTPFFRRFSKAHDLVEILDLIRSIAGEVDKEWLQWKAERPDIFPV